MIICLFCLKSLESNQDLKRKESSSGTCEDSDTRGDVLPKRKPTYEWGWLDIDQFVQKLSQEGINDAKVEHGNPGYIIHLVYEGLEGKLTKKNIKFIHD